MPTDEQLVAALARYDAAYHARVIGAPETAELVRARMDLVLLLAGLPEPLPALLRDQLRRDAATLVEAGDVTDESPVEVPAQRAPAEPVGSAADDSAWAASGAARA